MIYHICKQSLWEEAQKKAYYLPAEFEKDGFIHASEWFQLEKVANNFYRAQEGLLVLEIETRGADLPLIYENLEGGNENFPHIYGKLPIQTVVDTFYLDQTPDGLWRMPKEKQRFVDPSLTLLPVNTPGKLYRSSMPYSRMFDPDSIVFDQYLKAGIDWVIVLNLSEELLYHSGHDLLNEYEQAGMQVLHLPVPDFSAPAAGAWNAELAQAAQLLREGQNLAVHCHAGIGRTGGFVTCLAQDLLGLSGEESIDWVRQYIPSAVESEYQRQFVLDYQKHKQ